MPGQILVKNGELTTEGQELVTEHLGALSTLPILSRIVLQNRKALCAFVIETLYDRFRDDLQIPITTERTGRKMMKLMMGAALKVALNMFTLGLGSLLFDQLHTFFDTHGPSMMDGAKTRANDESEDVALYGRSEWSAPELDAWALTRQYLSDAGDMAIETGLTKSTSALETGMQKLGKLGADIREILRSDGLIPDTAETAASALDAFVKPLAAINDSILFMEAFLREQITAQLPQDKVATEQDVVAAVQQVVADFRPNNQLKNILNLTNQLPIPEKRALRRLFLAELLYENASLFTHSDQDLSKLTKMLSSPERMSSAFWTALRKDKLVEALGKGHEDELIEEGLEMYSNGSAIEQFMRTGSFPLGQLVPEDARPFSIKDEEEPIVQYCQEVINGKAQNRNKILGMAQRAYQANLIAVTTKAEKFGTSSTAASLLTAATILWVTAAKSYLSLSKLERDLDWKRASDALAISG